MKNTVKYVPRQMDLLSSEEWRLHSSPVTGKDVYHSHTGRVREQWISDCNKERVLTSGMLSEIACLGNLDKSCQKVISNKGSSGIDGMTTFELGAWFNTNNVKLSKSMLNGNYQPESVLEIEIPKPSGGIRKLGIPTAIDRLVQQAIHQVLSQRYERIFSSHSYGFRPGRSAHDAIHESARLISAGYNWLVDIDLEKFFDTVNQQRLMWYLSLRVGDKRVLKLIHRILKSGVLTGGLINQRTSGTPQGGPLSPLLSNIVLDELDKELERRGHKFVRYADDIRIFVKSEKSAARVLKSVTEFIEKRLRLKVNGEKSKISKGYQTNFLGYSFKGDGTPILSRDSERRFKDGIKKIVSRRRGISLDQLIRELNLKLRGWLNYFRFAQMKSRVSKLMAWIRRRLRCFRLKQCKRAFSIVKFLRKLDVPEWRCWLIALSGKGWWRLAGTPQAQEGMDLKWFKKTGLFDLKDNYLRLKLEETAVYQQVCTVV